MLFTVQSQSTAQTLSIAITAGWQQSSYIQDHLMLPLQNGVIFFFSFFIAEHKVAQMSKSKWNNKGEQRRTESGLRVIVILQQFLLKL